MALGGLCQQRGLLLAAPEELSWNLPSGTTREGTFTLFLLTPARTEEGPSRGKTTVSPGEGGRGEKAAADSLPKCRSPASFVRRNLPSLDFLNLLPLPSPLPSPPNKSLEGEGEKKKINKRENKK